MSIDWMGMQRSVEETRRSWAAFRRGHPPDLRVRPPIIRSWQRCQAAGLTAAEPGGRAADVDRGLEAARSAHKELIGAAAPILANLKGALRDTGQVLVLCDPDARALLVEGDVPARRAAEGINLVPGSQWSEAASGTNAMGTALAEARHVTVFAAEHFLEQLHSWACAAAPIFHPATGRAMGVLDLSGRAMAVNAHSELAVLGAAEAIRARLAAREAILHGVLLSALADRTASARYDGLGVIDRHGQMLRFSGPMPSPPHDWAGVLERLQQEGGEVEEQVGTLRLRYRPVLWEGERIGALVEAARASRKVVTEAKPEPPLAGLVGQDPLWLTALERAARGAGTDSTMLISGETGTGKEVVAKAIHQASARSRGPFVAVNCGALPPNLAASELFGYVGGAFTGANPRGRAGLFETADRGTLFLDEVSELSPESQVALLRVLQEREVMRLGAHHPTKVDIRVIAATNKDLAELVSRGLFRQDLYFRLNVVSISLPPLRERTQDIIALVAHGYRILGREPRPLPPSSWQRLLQHPWPGNVRELLNLVEQAVALDEDPANLLPLPPLPATRVSAECDEGEAALIRKALAEHRGNAAAAARALGMGRSTLYRKLELYDIRLKRQVE